MLWCFIHLEEGALGENYKEAYEVWRDRKPMTRINIDAELLLKQKNYNLNAKRITAVEIDGRKRNMT
jgi:hypothetical protein